MTHRSDHGSIENGTLIHSSRTVRFALAVVLLAALCCLQVALGMNPSQASAEACSNAEFRTGPSADLPECRAYEMVSPPNKQGGDIQSVVNFVSRYRASESGDAIIYPSSVGFSDEQGMSTAAFYRATREESGWESESVTPPIAPFGIYATSFGPNAASKDLETLVHVANVDENGEPLVDGAGTPSTDLALLFERSDGTMDMIFRRENDTSNSSIGRVNLAASDDFSTIYFAANATEVLTPDGHPDGGGLYRYQDGQLSFESILPNGATTSAAIDGNGRDGLRRTSTDGEVVHFDVGTTGELFRRESGETFQINASENPALPVGGASQDRFRTMSTDGSRSLFTTASPLVASDAQAGQDLYLYKQSDDPDNDGNLTHISVDSEGGDGTSAYVQGVLGASDDLSRVYFVANGQLVPGEPTTAARKIYIWEDGPGGGSIEYLGGLNAGDSQVWKNVVSSVNERTSQVSPDGRFVMLRTSNTSLAPDDNGGLAQIYVYDRSRGEWSCASCRKDGNPPASTAEFSRDLQVGRFNQERLINLSSEGHAFFETAEPLVPTDTNGETDVYVWKDDTVHAISGGRSTKGSFFADASADGSAVFFVTRERLTQWDTDGALDLYAAPVGGGLAPPAEPPPSCLGDTCQSDAAASPGEEHPGSDGIFPGNPGPQQTDDSSCARFDQKAKKASKKTKKLKKRAKKVSGKKKSKQLRKKAKKQRQKLRKKAKKQRQKLRKKAKKQRQKSKRAKKQAKQCRGGSQ